MKKWENKVVIEGFHNDEEIQKLLNKIGNDGWEPVSISLRYNYIWSNVFIIVFKREILEPQLQWSAAVSQLPRISAMCAKINLFDSGALFLFNFQLFVLFLILNFDNLDLFGIWDLLKSYQISAITSPPNFLYLASLFVINPFDVEIIDIPYPPCTLSISENPW